MRIHLLAVASAVIVLAAPSCQTEKSKNEAAKTEVFTLIQNSETFKLPASFVLDTVTISLTRKEEIQSGTWEKGTGFSSTFGPVKNWKR